MKVRSLALVVVGFLTAGAVVNVAVALALFATGASIGVSRSQIRGYDEHGAHVSGPVICTINGRLAAEGAIPPWLCRSEAEGWHVRLTPGRWAAHFPGAITSAAGWPLPSVRWAPAPFAAPRRVAPPPWFDMTGGSVPRQVYWPGFAANSLVYAAALVMPLAFFPVRGAVRVRRGRCRRCGYDVTGLGQRPECGSAGPQSAPARLASAKVDGDGG